jgi:Cys-tRNA(Pro)/Cys-tRNA(Cys) deacylase
MKKTNAARILDRSRVPYELREYEVNELDLSAEQVATKVGLPLHQVFKTLVVRGDKTGVFLACVPGGAELDLKTMAAVSGNKKVEMVQMREIEPLTGYVRGGVSPLGTKKRYPLYLDESAMGFPFISISAGVRGCQILLSAERLAKILEAEVVRIARLS